MSADLFKTKTANLLYVSLLFFAAAFFVVPVHTVASRPAVTIGTDGSGYASIQEAITAMGEKGLTNDTITINENLTLQSQVTIPTGYEITIKSTSPVTITRNFYTAVSNSNRMFDVRGTASLTLSGPLTIDAAADNTNQPANRQMFRVGDGSNHTAALVLENGVTLQNNYTTSSGSGILNYGVTTVRATIKNNTCYKASTSNVNGGAIQCANDSTLFIEDGALITGNTATYGGGINMANASVTVRGGQITDNTAGTNGGNINVGAGYTLNIEGGTIKSGKCNNKANDISLLKASVMNLKGTVTIGTVVFGAADAAINMTGKLQTAFIRLNTHSSDRAGRVILTGASLYVEEAAPLITLSDSAYYINSEGKLIRNDGIRVKFFDVSEIDSWGDSIFIDFPDGTTMLIDTGYLPVNYDKDTQTFVQRHDYDCATDIIIKELKDMSVSRIDYLVLTHSHTDHVGGLTKIINNFNVGQAVTTGFWATDLRGDLVLKKAGITETVVGAGDKLSVCGANFDVLWPRSEDLTGITKDKEDTLFINPHSLMMKMSYGKNSILFTADVYKDAQTDILKLYGASVLKSDIIKIPHHGYGSNNAYNLNFLKAVAPKYAIAQETGDVQAMSITQYKALLDLGCTPYLGWTNGEVNVTMNGENITVVPETDGIPEVYLKQLDDYTRLSFSAVIGDDITAKFSAAPGCPDYYKNIELKVKLGNNKEITLTPSSASGNYNFDLEHIGLINMADLITARLVGETKDGEQRTIKELTENDGLSIAGYCDELYQIYKNDSALIRFIANMLKMGSKLQVYLDHNTAHLSDASAWVKEKAYAYEMTAGEGSTFDTEITVPLKDGNLKIKSANVELSNKISLSFNVFAGEEKDIKDVKLSVSAPGMKSVTLPLSELEKAGEIYKLRLPGLIPSKYDTVYTVSLISGDVIIHELKYSVYSYLYHKTELGETLGDLTKSIYDYGRSAKDYAN